MHAASCARAATPRLASIGARRFGCRGARAFTPTARPRRAPARLAIPSAAQQDDDFAVFRFTLGIPGFDDEDIPRVVGTVGAALLVANHLASSNPSEAQARTETVGAILAAACVITPSFGRRLNENAAINGGTLDVAGGEQVFAIAPGLSDAERADLAWGTYALLTQTNAQGALLWRRDGGVACARGSVRLPTTGVSPPGSPESVVAALTTTTGRSGAITAQPDANGATYMADRAAVDRARANEWEFLPQGAESVLVQTVGMGGKETRLVLLSDRPRAFSKKQRAWIAAVARKLGGARRE